MWFFTPSHYPLLLLLLLSTLQLPAQGTDTPRFREARERMVQIQIERRGITERQVVAAMRSVLRHEFVPSDARDSAYNDYPLRIGEGQTISQPYIVALMTESLDLKGSEKVLEIGTGSGYQAAVLSELVKEVYTIEIVKRLNELAAERLARLGYGNIKTRFGDGYFGWEEAAPFDRIMITAAVDHIPPPLLAQLTDGGKMILPLGSPYSYFGQTLVLVTKIGGDYRTRELLPVRFVPMTGRAQGITR